MNKLSQVQKKGFTLEPRYVGMCTFSTKKFETRAHTILFLYQHHQDNHPRMETYLNPFPCHSGTHDTCTELSKLYWIEYHLWSQNTVGCRHTLVTPSVSPWSSAFLVPPLMFCPFFISGLLSNFVIVCCWWGVSLSWSTCAIVVPLRIKMYLHGFSSYFLSI